MFEEAEFKARHRSLGNIRLIGELFKLKVYMRSSTEVWFSQNV